MTAFIKPWMTASEIAGLGLPKFPRTAKGIDGMADRKGWTKGGPERVRTNEAGEREFAIANIPAAMLGGYIAREDEARRKAEAGAIRERWQEDRRAFLPALLELNESSRRCVEGRIALLFELEHSAALNDWTLSHAVNRLREDLLADRSSLELRDHADAASERQGFPSRTTLYAWVRTYKQIGLGALIPQDRGVSRALHGMIPDRIRMLLLLAEEPARELSERRVRRCAAMLASMTPAERDRTLDLNSNGVRAYAKARGWRTG